MKKINLDMLLTFSGYGNTISYAWEQRKSGWTAPLYIPKIPRFRCLIYFTGNKEWEIGKHFIHSSKILRLKK